VYFYFVYSKKDGWKTLVCSDQSSYMFYNFSSLQL
jgi:hypothetical protein